MSDKLKPADLDAELQRLEAKTLFPASNADELLERLQSIYQDLAGLDFAHYDMSHISASAPALLQRMFQVRMQLRDQLRTWRNQALLTGDVQHALRSLFRAMRYGTDMLGEAAIGFHRMGEHSRPLRAFTGRNNNTLINPRFNEKRDLPFRSGDLLLVRGRHHNSAAIARIGDVDSQYSHLGIVYVDPKGYHWLVEVLIEEGGVIKPLGEAISHDLSRAIVFRHPNAALAQRAAFIAHEHIKASQARYGKPILYDFTMQQEGYKRLFCSKLIRLAFEKASEGAMILPTFPTRMSMRNRDFFDRIGVTATETFAPGDIELEPGFDVVAEWSDYRITASARHQDIVMDKLFQWMDAYDLTFKETFLINLIARGGRVAAGLSNTIKSMIAEVIPVVPPHMKRQTIATIVMLHRTADPLMHDLERVERERIGLFGYPLHPREAAEYLERWRAKSGDEIGYLVPALKVPAKG